MTECKNHHKCKEEAIKSAINICQDHGLRFTNLRKYVFEAVLENHLPTKAYDILSKLQTEDASAKPPTVYRALDFLLENGLIHKLHRTNGYIACSHPLKHDQCYFLYCLTCGDTSECCDKDLAKAIDKVTKNNNFEAKNVTIEIEGVCSNCASLKPNK